MPNPSIGMPSPTPGGLYGPAPSMPQPGGGYASWNLSFGVCTCINNKEGTYKVVQCMSMNEQVSLKRQCCGY